MIISGLRSGSGPAVGLCAVLSALIPGRPWRRGPVPWAYADSCAGSGCCGGDICAGLWRELVPVVWPWCRNCARGCSGHGAGPGAVGGRMTGRSWGAGPDEFRRSGDRCGRGRDRLAAGGTVSRGVIPPVPCRPPVPWARLSPALCPRGFVRTAPGLSRSCRGSVAQQSH